MRLRQMRFLSVPDAEAATFALAASAGPLSLSDAELPKPDELSWWDWTVFLLHTAAEIEHSLLVQYLYAAYSLGSAPFEGPNVPADAEALVSGWRETILEIARQEMGLEQLHLAARGGMGLERFYARLGWREIGRWPGALRLAPGDDRDEVLMILAPV